MTGGSLLVTMRKGNKPLISSVEPLGIFLTSVSTEMSTIAACTHVDRAERASMVSIRTVVIVILDFQETEADRLYPHHKCPESLLQFLGE